MDQGYCLINNFFPKEKITNIRCEMESIFQSFSSTNIIGNSDQFIMDLFQNDFTAFIGCCHLCQKLPSLFRLAASKEILDFLYAQGIKFPVLNTKPLVSFSSQYTAKTESHWKIGSHQDWASNLGSSNGITCWIPLQTVDYDLGPLEISPNSNLLGELKHTGIPPIIESEDLEYISLPMQVGDALFFDTLTVHKSGTNKTNDKIRWSMHFRYNDALEASFIERKYPRNRTND